MQQHAPIKTIAALHKQRLIGYVDDLIYSPQLRYFDEVLPGLRPQISSTSILAQLEMTRAGTGLCILPSFIANRYPELTPVLVDQINVERSFWLVVHEDVANYSRIRVVKDCIVEMFEQNKERFSVLSEKSTPEPP